MFAYCGNNPVIRVDVDGAAWEDIMEWVNRSYYLNNSYHYEYNKSLKVSGYIYNQNSGVAAKYWFGFYRSSYNGCGWIATYNATIMLGARVDPHKIIRRYERSGALIYGTFGILTSAVSRYFRDMGYKVTVTRNSSKFDEVAKNNTANIIWFWHGKGAHFVALRWNGKQFIGYNTFSGSTGVDYWGASIEGFLKKYGFNPSVLISMR